jgi:hypothetical protein
MAGRTSSLRVARIVAAAWTLLVYAAYWLRYLPGAR